MSLAVLFLISTIKTFPTAMPQSGPVYRTGLAVRYPGRVCMVRIPGFRERYTVVSGHRTSAPRLTPMAASL